MFAAVLVVGPEVAVGHFRNGFRMRKAKMVVLMEDVHVGLQLKLVTTAWPEVVMVWNKAG